MWYEMLLRPSRGSEADSEGWQAKVQGPWLGAVPAPAALGCPYFYVYFQTVDPRREGWVGHGDGSLIPVIGEEGKKGETKSHEDRDRTE